MGIKHDDDASLHRWGRNLGSVGPAISELAARQRQLDEEVAAARAAVAKLAEQGTSDLPASPAVVAQIEALNAELRTIESAGTAAALARVATNAETLPGQYRHHHETDEARFDGERGTRAQERRADVSAAEQDV